MDLASADPSPLVFQMPSTKTASPEFSNDAKFTRGTCGMARSAHPNSANSQFFIMFEPAPHLNGQYTNFGQVTVGLDLVVKIAIGDKIKKITVK